MEPVQVDGDFVVFRRKNSEKNEFAIRASEVKSIERMKEGVLINGDLMDNSYEEATRAVIDHMIGKKKHLNDCGGT